MIQPNNYRIDEAKYKSLLKYIRLSVTEKYEFPQEIVQIDGVTIATIGNFSASTGKPKSKKTFNVSASNWQDCLLTRKMTTSNSWFCENTLPTKGEILYDGHSTKSKTSGS